MATTEKSLTGFSDLFKRRYGTLSDVLYGSGVEDPLEAAIRKTYGLNGEDFRFPIKTQFGGSAGFGSLPTANYVRHVTPVMDSHRAYARLLIDRRTMKASASNEAAFARAYDYEVKSKVKNFTRVQAMVKYNGGQNGSCVLGQFGAAATGTAAAPVITILNTGDYRWRPAFFEEGDIVEVEKDVTGTPLLQASKFEITAINTATRAVTLSRLTGSVDLTNAGFDSQTHNVVLEGSSYYGTGAGGANTRKTPHGLLDILLFTSGTLYTAAYGRRYAPCHIEDASGKLLTTDLLNKVVTQFMFKTGEVPDKIITSYKQFELFTNQEESKKRYTVGSMSGSNSVNGIVASFGSAKFASSRGVIDIVPSRYMRDDIAAPLKVSEFECKHLDGFGWFDDDGTIILRSADEDSYEARYGGYYENWINPFYCSFITGLATA